MGPVQAHQRRWGQGEPGDRLVVSEEIWQADEDRVLHRVAVP